MAHTASFRLERQSDFRRPGFKVAHYHLVPEGTPGAMAIAVKRVNETGFYNLGLRDMAKKLAISDARLLAVIRHLKIQESEDFFKEITIGKSRFKRYSGKALSHLKERLSTIDVAAIWQQSKVKL